MSHFTLQPNISSAPFQAKLPFRLGYHKGSSSLDEARRDSALIDSLNDSFQQHEWVISRAARQDNFPQDKLKEEGRVLLFEDRLGRSTYDAYVSFKANETEESSIDLAQLERNGKSMLEMATDEEGKITAKLYSAEHRGYFLVKGTVGGSASVTRA